MMMMMMDDLCARLAREKEREVGASGCPARSPQPRGRGPCRLGEIALTWVDVPSVRRSAACRWPGWMSTPSAGRGVSAAEDPWMQPPRAQKEAQS